MALGADHEVTPPSLYSVRPHDVYGFEALGKRSRGRQSPERSGSEVTLAFPSFLKAPGRTRASCLVQSPGPRAAGAERRALRLRKACRVTPPSTIQTRSVTAVEASTVAGPPAGGAPASAGAPPSSPAAPAGGRPPRLGAPRLVPP